MPAFKMKKELEVYTQGFEFIGITDMVNKLKHEMK